MFTAAILRNEVGWFDEEENNSSLVAAHLAVDAADVKSAIAERISVILQNMTSLMTSFVVGFIIEWRVAILILATFPLLVLANFAQVIPGLLLFVILRLNLPFESIFKETRLANLIACQNQNSS
jgi:ATP-binding cassette, subfamily B (MDR/TAP), member 1